MYVVKIACERPDELGRSLSQWDCTEIARQLMRDGVVTKISAETVRQILLSHHLKPWRQKMWLSAKVPRDFRAPDGTIGLRSPNHEVVRELLQAFEHRTLMRSQILYGLLP